MKVLSFLKLSSKTRRSWMIFSLFSAALLLLLVFVFRLLGSVGEEALVEESQEAPLALAMYELGSEEAPSIMLRGTLESEQDWLVVAERGGIVKKLSFEDGDDVSQGALLMDFSSVTDSYQLKSAALAVESAKASYELAKNASSPESKERSQFALQQAALGVKQSANAYESVENQYESQQNAMEAQLRTLKNSMGTGLESFLAYKSARESQKNLYKNTGDAIRNVLLGSDSILGVDQPLYNDAFEDSLSLENTEALRFAEISYRQAKSENDQALLLLNTVFLGASDKAYRDLEKESLEALAKAEEHLLDMADVLKYSVPNVDFPQAQKQSFMQMNESSLRTVREMETAILSAKQGVEQAEKAYKDLEIQKKNLEKDLQILANNKKTALDSAYQSLLQSQLNYETMKSAHQELLKGARKVDLQPYLVAIAQAENSLASLSAELSKAKIVSPMNGFIQEIFVEEGAFVAPGQALMKLSQPGALSWETELSLDNAKRLSVKDPVFFNGEEVGFVSKLARAVSQSSKQVKMKVILTKEIPALLGERVALSFRPSSKEAGLYIPTQSVFYKGSEAFAYQIVEGRLVAAALQLGDLQGEEILVLGGLKKGQKVVENVRGLREGMLVSPLES